MDKRAVIALIVLSWPLYPTRVLRHKWVRSKMILGSTSPKIPMGLGEAMPSLLKRNYKEITLCPISREEFLNPLERVLGR